MTTTTSPVVRKNGTVEFEGRVVGHIETHPYGYESFPLAETGQPRRYHGKRKWAVEVLVHDAEDARRKADPSLGWAERDGVFWAAYAADGTRVGLFHHTRAAAYAAL